MKKIFYLSISLIIASLVMGPTTLYSQKKITDRDEAERILEQYFYGLKNGNTSEILNLITGPLLKKRERLLRYNTQYGTFLKEKYEYAQFSIIGYRFIDNSKITFDVEIVFRDQNSFKREFVIVEDMGFLKIYSEEESPSP